MTHSDIKTKFLIEYDKANIASSYPSLTDYEIATILDRAYLALIALKLTGNNIRRSSFESDIKAIEDLRPLIVTKPFEKNDNVVVKSSNEVVYNLPSDLLYYLESVVVVNNAGDTRITKLVTHDQANRFRNTSTNRPWVNVPVTFIDYKYLRLLYDDFAKYTKLHTNTVPSRLIGTYIKTPKKFAIIDDYADTQEEETWMLSVLNISQDYLIYNANNKFYIEAEARSSDGNYSGISYQIISGGEYATVDSSGVITVLPTSEAVYNTVTIRLLCNEDPSVSDTFDIHVLYHPTPGVKPSPTPTPIDETEWNVNITNKTLYIYNYNNIYQYNVLCKDNNNNTSSVAWQIISGNSSARINSSGQLTVLSTATEYKEVIVRAICVEDNSVYDQTSVLVKFYKEEPQLDVYTIQCNIDSKTLYNSDNAQTITAYATKNGEAVESRIEIVGGSEYASYDYTTNQLVVLTTAEDFKTVTINAYVVEHPETQVYRTITVKYYPSGQTFQEEWSILFNNFIQNMNIQNYANRFVFDAQGVSTLGNTSGVIYSIENPTVYCTVTSNGVLTINNIDNDVHWVLIVITCAKDTTVKEYVTVNVKYTPQLTYFTLNQSVLDGMDKLA